MRGRTRAALYGCAVMILAQTPESWTQPEPMPWLEVLGVFVGVPALLFLLIIVAVSAPSMIKRGGYRPGLSWWAAPEWFGTRPEDASADAESRTEEPVVTGGVGARW